MAISTANMGTTQGDFSAKQSVFVYFVYFVDFVYFVYFVYFVCFVYFNPLHQRQLSSSQHLLDDDLSSKSDSFDASLESNSDLEDDSSRDWDAWSNGFLDSSRASSRVSTVGNEVKSTTRKSSSLTIIMDRFSTQI